MESNERVPERTRADSDPENIELKGRTFSQWRRANGHQTQAPETPFVEDDAPTISQHDPNEDDESESDYERPWWKKLYKNVVHSLNFYRVHMLVFTLVSTFVPQSVMVRIAKRFALVNQFPFMVSGIFYACNGRYHIDYIDSLFLCVSAMTVTGLATVNLSSLTPWQQVMLALLMVFGNIMSVGLIMITVRKYFFRKAFDKAIEERWREMRKDQEQGRRMPLRKARAIGNRIRQSSRDKHSKLWQNLFYNDADGNDVEESATPTNAKSQGASASEESSPGGTLSDKKNANAGMFPAKPSPAASVHTDSERELSGWGVWTRHKKKVGHKTRKIRADMIKRVDGGGMGVINPMGWINSTPFGSSDPEGKETGRRRGSVASSSSGRRARSSVSHLPNPFLPEDQTPGPGILDHSHDPDGGQAEASAPKDLPSPNVLGIDHVNTPLESRLPADPKAVRSNTEPADIQLGHSAEANRPASPVVTLEDRFPRTRTIAFDGIDDAPRTAYTSARETGGMYHHQPGHGHLPRTGTIRSADPASLGVGEGTGLGLDRTLTERRSTMGSGMNPRRGSGNMPPRALTLNQQAAHQGFGGFPTPVSLGKSLFHKAFPKASNKLQRSFTMHSTVPQGGKRHSTIDGVDVKPVEYISFDAIVGRNSHFHELTEEEHEELGGVEYRSLRVLFWIVLSYLILLPILGFIICGPYIKLHYEWAFTDPSQMRYVDPYWYSAFQVISAFSNTGMALTDTSMVPFQKAYPLIFVTIVLIFAGNTAFPVW